METSIQNWHNIVIFRLPYERQRRTGYRANRYSTGVLKLAKQKNLENYLKKISVIAQHGREF